MARGWDTQERARAEIQRLTGWSIPQSVYAEWESGRRVPAGANLERLNAFYGDQPAATTTDSDVAAAIREQTAALVSAIQGRDAVIQALLEELATYRRQTLERQETERALIEALPEALAIALASRPANGHVDERSATLPREAAERR